VLLALAILLLFASSLRLGLLSGLWVPAALSGTALSLFVGTLAAAWFYCGRDLIGRAELADAPRHAYRVAQAAFAFMRGARSSWVRAERNGD
jgi:hypothetical protein